MLFRGTVRFEVNMKVEGWDQDQSCGFPCNVGSAAAENSQVRAGSCPNRPPHLMICCCFWDCPPRKRSFSSAIALPSFRVGVGGASDAYDKP